MTPLRKIRNYVSKVFMMTPIHVLCSNFTRVVRQPEVGETMVTKSSQMRFFGAILRQLGRGRQTFAGGVPRDPMTHCKISPQLVPICRSNFVRLQYMSGVGRPATFTDAYNRQEV